GLAVAIFGSGAGAVEAPTPLTDSLVLGESASEQAHGLKSEQSQVIQGGLDQPARQLLPRQPLGDYGGSIFFILKCDPEKPTYLLRVAGSVASGVTEIHWHYFSDRWPSPRAASMRSTRTPTPVSLHRLRKNRGLRWRTRRFAPSPVPRCSIASRTESTACS